MLSLYFDDVRPSPPGWLLARTVDSCIDQLIRNKIQRISLDHDMDVCPTCHGDVDAPGSVVRGQFATQSGILAPCVHNHTGMEVLVWMASTGVWPDIVWVHSGNLEKADEMRAFIKQYKPIAA